MDKPFPPWKYWTKTSLTNTLTQVMANLAEEAKKNVRGILSAHNCVAEIENLELLIETNPADCTLIIDFTHGKFPIGYSNSKWKSALEKSQFDILKDISRLLTTMSLKPDVKIITRWRERRLTSLTNWQHIVELSDGKMRFEDWTSTACFSSQSGNLRNKT